MILIWILGIAAALILVALAAFLIYRAIVVKKLRREHKIEFAQGIDEEVILEIGDIEQYLYIRGENIENPVILFLHGGPGGAMVPMLHTYQYLWEKDYTVVNWDQRGCGKTYFLNKDNRPVLSAEKMLEDIHEIVLYLKERFGKDKVIVVGHSWGTILGSQYALSHPEYVQAYVGVAQVIDINEGVIEMGQYVKQFANAKDAEKLDRIMEAVGKCEGVAEKETLAISKIAKPYIPVNMDTTIFIRNGLFSPYFSLKELTYYTKMDELTKPLNQYMVDYDLRESGAQYQVPIVYILGEYDWHMNLLAEKYFDDISAPYKKCIKVPGAGHVVMMDKPDEFFGELHRTLQESQFVVK